MSDGISFAWTQHPPTVPETTADGADPVTHDVAIVGGGPVGLTAAAQLRRLGIRSVVLEADDTVCPTSRANGMSYRTLELYDRISSALATRMVDTGVVTNGSRTFFGRREIVSQLFPEMVDPGARFPRMHYLPQWFIEQFLLDELEADDLCEVRWVNTVTELERDEDGVTLTVQTPGRDPYTLRTRWLLACDGGRSTIRRQLGHELVGSDYAADYVIVDALIDGIVPEPTRWAWFDPPGLRCSTLFQHAAPEGMWRIDYQLAPGTDVEQATRRAAVVEAVTDYLENRGLGRPTVRPVWISPYKARALSLERYRDGRVFFVGDAAHLYPIFGGYGMTSGVDDADNLTWKLALHLKGQAPEALLDSYDAERRAATQGNLRIVMTSAETQSPTSAASHTLLQAGLSLAAQDVEPARLLIRARPTSPAEYPDSPLNRASEDRTAFASGPAAGEIMPDRILTSVDGGQTTTQQLLGDGLTILHFCGGATSDAVIAALRAIPTTAPVGMHTIGRASGGDGEHHDATGRIHEIMGAEEAGATYIVRPDAYVMARWHGVDVDAIADCLQSFDRKGAVI